MNGTTYGSGVTCPSEPQAFELMVTVLKTEPAVQRTSLDQDELGTKDRAAAAPRRSERNSVRPRTSEISQRLDARRSRWCDALGTS